MQTAQTQSPQSIYYYLWLANYMYSPIESNDSTADYYNSTAANDEHFLNFLDRSYKWGIPMNGRDTLEELISHFVNRQTSVYGLSTIREQYEKWLNHTLLLTKGTFELNDVSDWCRNYDIEEACRDLRLEHIDTDHNLTTIGASIAINEVTTISDSPSEIVTFEPEIKPINKPHKVNYKIDHLYVKIDRLYDFAVGDVFNESFTNSNFRVFVETADFSQLLSDIKTRKSKLKTIITKLNSYIGDKEWYRDAAKSIGTTPSGCSGTNTSNWKWDEDLVKL